MMYRHRYRHGGGMDVEEQERAVREGFPVLGGDWPVAASHHLTNGVLLADGPVTRRYLPGAHVQLPTELAKVDSGGDAAIIDFAQNWGSLGYARLVHADDTLSDEEQHRRVTAVGGGDPVPWIR